VKPIIVDAPPISVEKPKDEGTPLFTVNDILPEQDTFNEANKTVEVSGNITDVNKVVNISSEVPTTSLDQNITEERNGTDS